MYLDAHVVAVGHHGHVGGYHGGDMGLAGGVYYLVHGGYVVIVDDGVDGEVGLDAMAVARGGYVVQVGYGKVVSRVRPHIQLPNAEIDRACSGLYGSSEALARTDRGHNLKIR